MEEAVVVIPLFFPHIPFVLLITVYVFLLFELDPCLFFKSEKIFATEEKCLQVIDASAILLLLFTSIVHPPVVSCFGDMSATAMVVLKTGGDAPKLKQP